MLEYKQSEYSLKMKKKKKDKTEGYKKCNLRNFLRQCWKSVQNYAEGFGARDRALASRGMRKVMSCKFCLGSMKRNCCTPVEESLRNMMGLPITLSSVLVTVSQIRSFTTVSLSH